MRILWINPNFLHPTTKGGQIRTLGILRELHREHEIDYVAYLGDTSEEMAEGPRRAGEYSRMHLAVPSTTASKTSPRFYLDLLRGLVDPMPVAVRRFDSRAFRDAVARMRRENAYDVVVVDFLASAPAVPDIENTVLFQHNVESMIWKRRLEQARSFAERTYLREQWKKMCRYEGDICRRAKKVIAVSEADAREMESQYGARNVGWTDTGVDVDYFTPPADGAASAGGGEVAFVGSMDWMPNVDGIEWFLDEVWPRIRAARPAATFSITGRRPPPAISAQNGRNGVTVTGTVPDVRPYLWGSRISVVPLRIGGGTRLKIYEAMAAKSAVVSTSIGAEGLSGEPGKEIALADTPVEFAGACLRLLEDEEARKAQADSAWTMVDQHFRWSAVARDFAALLSKTSA